MYRSILVSIPDNICVSRYFKEALTTDVGFDCPQNIRFSDELFSSPALQKYFCRIKFVFRAMECSVDNQIVAELRMSISSLKTRNSDCRIT